MRRAVPVLAALLGSLALAPASHAAGCTGVSVKGPGTVPETAGVAIFKISADELPPPPPPDPQFPSDPQLPPPETTCSVDVSFDTADGTAQAGADYLPVRGSVVLDAGQATKVEVPIGDDQIDEPDEDFTLHTNEGSATATIADDDAAPTISVASAPALEGATAEVFTVTLSAPSAFPVSATYATTDGTATAGSDYVPTSGTVTFPPGTTKQIVSVPLVDDRVREGDESFSLVLGTGTTASAVVRDDDATAPSAGGGVPAGPTAIGALDTFPPKITVPPGEQTGESTITFTVSCPVAEQLCSGRVRLDLVAGGKGARAAAVTSLGSTKYKLKGGETKKVRVKLNERGKKLLKKRKKLRVKATFRTRDAAGNVTTTSQILTLHAGAFRHS